MDGIQSWSYLVVERTTGPYATGSSASRAAATTSRTISWGERVELVLGPAELEVYSMIDGRRIARHDRGRLARVLPDPVENSISLATVLQALPVTEVHRRPLSVYQELADG